MLLVVSWFAIDLNDGEADAYPGGVSVCDASGRVLRVTLGPGDVDCRPTYRASPDDRIVQALVAVEDSEFWTHCGVRPLSAVRALMQNVFYRGRISGASTITMQAVRLIRPHPKSYFEKWCEAFRALKLERRHDKLWILSQYLNRAPFGSNLVGIEAGAQGWFGKSARRLAPDEAALLAGMVQAPSRLRPDRHLRTAMARRDFVLARMHHLGYLDDETFAHATSAVPRICRSPRPFAEPWFCDWMLADLPRDVRGEVRTSLDPDVQHAAKAVCDEIARGHGVEAAAVILRVRDGAVVAMTRSGAYDEPEAGRFNFALAARSAGSTLKPLLVAQALDQGLVTPETRLIDAPCAFSGYLPTNFDSRYHGAVSVRDALVLSLNVPFVKLLKEIGVESFRRELVSLGFTRLASPTANYGLGLAIGNAEVSLLELAHAYADLAGGRHFSPEAAYLVSEMLSGTARSHLALGHVADVVLPRFAWKTGTSSAYGDAWTVAWNPEYVVGIWCGRLRGGFGDRTLVGAQVAAPAVWQLVRGLYPQGYGPWFSRPEGLVERQCCRLSGAYATPDCPATDVGLALAGVSLPTPCSWHRRDAQGRVFALLPPGADGADADGGRCSAQPPRLRFLRPESGAVYVGSDACPAELVCRVQVPEPDVPLWWFLDGVPSAESKGDDAVILAAPPGDHALVVSTARGETARVTFTVRDD